MKRRIFLGAALGLGASVVGCSSESDEPTTLTAEGEMAMLTFTLKSADGAIERGMNDLTLEITSSAGVEAGLAVTATLEMPSMTHGADELEVAIEGDAYVIEQADFSMTGDWLLRVEATRDGAMLDHASFTVSVA